jgi:hypothetical protein
MSYFCITLVFFVLTFNTRLPVSSADHQQDNNMINNHRSRRRVLHVKILKQLNTAAQHTSSSEHSKLFIGFVPFEKKFINTRKFKKFIRFFKFK